MSKTQTAVVPWSCYDTCVPRLIRVRAQPSVSMSASCVWLHRPHRCSALFFWLKPASTFLRAHPGLLTVLAGAISSLSIQVVGDCPIVPPSGFAFQPACFASHPVAKTRHVKAHHDQSPLSVIAGCISAERQAPLKVSGQKLPVKTPTSSSTLLRASLSECARALFLIVLVIWFLAKLS